MKVGEIWAPTPQRIKNSSGWISLSSNRAKQTPENSRWREPEGNVRILELNDYWNAFPGKKYFVVFEYLDFFFLTFFFFYLFFLFFFCKLKMETED